MTTASDRVFHASKHACDDYAEREWLQVALIVDWFGGRTVDANRVTDALLSAGFHASEHRKGTTTPWT
jgi:hypothetical protein